MQKLCYLMWKSDTESEIEFGARLLAQTSKALLKLGAHRLKFNVIDEVVFESHFRFASDKPAFSAMVSFFLNSAHIRAPYEELLRGACSRIAGYAVTDSVALPQMTATEDGERSEGFYQVVALSRPHWLTYDAWLDIWQGDQTRVAIETQSTTYYGQNIVDRPVTFHAPPWDAIVEEGFPLAAIDDEAVIYNAKGDSTKREKNFRAMMNNVERFIDPERCNGLWTSEFRFGNWTDLTQPDLFQLGVVTRE